jgi:hypothetical protein
MQEHQRAATKRAKSLFKMRIRAAFQGSQRIDLFHMWQSAVRKGNWKVVRVLFRYIIKLPYKFCKQP